MRVERNFTLEPECFQIHPRVIYRRRTRRSIAQPAKAYLPSRTPMPARNASAACARHVWKCSWQNMEHEGSAHAVQPSAVGSSLFSSTSDEWLSPVTVRHESFFFNPAGISFTFYFFFLIGARAFTSSRVEQLFGVYRKVMILYKGVASRISSNIFSWYLSCLSFWSTLAFYCGVLLVLI